MKLTPEDEDIFLNCHHFSQANKFLREVGREEIDWSIPLKDL
jgi:uracil DNA glycosylase